MRILQLGNGGGLNPLLTNSAFLIDIGVKDKHEYILFDCGFNIMERLIKGEEKEEFLIKDIKHVYISHNDEDHIGSIQTFIYWQFFKNKVVVNLFSGPYILNFEATDINKLMVGGLIEETTIVNILINRSYNIESSRILPSFTINNEVFCYMVSAYHGRRDCYGLLIAMKDEVIFISGDTKANHNIERHVNLILKNYQDEKLRPKLKSLYFHDYSVWDAPSRNFHACRSDFSVEYSEEFQKKCIKYHTGVDNFESDWRTL